MANDYTQLAIKDFLWRGGGASIGEPLHLSSFNRGIVGNVDST